MGVVREALDFNIALHAVGNRQVAHVLTTADTGCRVDRPLLTAQPRAAALLERIAERVKLSTALPGPAAGPVQELGTLMFDSLFDETARSLLLSCKRQAKHERRTLRITLNAHSGGLDLLPWEFLYDPAAGEHLAVDHPFVRKLDLLTDHDPLPVETPLRVLGMVSRPPGLARLAVEEERADLHSALRELVADGLVELSWVQGQSWHALRDALHTVRPHVLHFIGHGGVDPETDEGTLAFTDERTGDRLDVAASDVSPLMEGTLRLVVLNACGTGRASRLDPFSSIATSILRKGVPAVVAMQFPISDKAALEFSREFYECLAGNDTVHLGVQRARQSMRTRLKRSLEWGTPVLYLRSGIERIFDVHTPLPPGPPRTRPWPPPGNPGPPAVGGLRPVRTVPSAFAVHSVSLSRGGELLAVGGDSRSVRIVDVATGREIRTFRLGWLNSGPCTVSFSPDATLFAAAGRQRMILWQTVDGREAAVVDFGNDIVTGPRKLSFSPDSMYIATSGWTGAAIWQAADGRIVHRLPVHRTVADVGYSPDGAHLVTAHTEGRLLLWDTQGRRPPVRSFTHSGLLNAVVFSRPDGKRLITAGVDGCACVWELPHGMEVRRIPHRAALNAIAVSPDGRRLATGGDDGRVCLWSLERDDENGRPRIMRHDGPVTTVAFSDDGRLLASGGVDRNVQIWQLEEEWQDE
ncbi:CHAT domain-containing protein [Streptomyces sp. NPDC001795]|uniref:CHAT domain-containing WD40 repeat protein n=1 Tax=Streptomyces sp. NPDC001795 TaxID=3154525 RepID=UPI0033241BC9